MLLLFLHCHNSVKASDIFYDKVLVMDENDTVRRNRLRLLKQSLPRYLVMSPILVCFLVSRVRLD